MNASQTPSLRVAVVGAGIAGLACATALARAGHTVTVFDKGRRPGGRVATRRVDGASFDHGAQFVTASGEAFAALMQDLATTEVMRSWPAAGQRGRIAWVGSPGMSALPRAMADSLAALGAEIHTGRHVAWLHEGGLLRHLSADDARPGSTQDSGGEVAGPFDRILLAVPAPQAAALLATCHHPFAADLAGVALAPCWAVMATFGETLGAPDVIRPEAGPLAWIARDSNRPGHAAKPECWVLHATPSWSRQHLEDPADEVVAALMQAFRDATGATVPPERTAAHRWRHAQVETPLGAPCLWDAEAGLGLCGDWCLGPRVEAAYDSGTALARMAMETPTGTL